MTRKSDPDPVTPTASGARLRLYVQPRASRTELAGLHGNALKVRLAAPPVDGAANEALVRWIAEKMGLPSRAVSIAAGASSRSKTVDVAGVSADDVRRRLAL